MKSKSSQNIVVIILMAVLLILNISSIRYKTLTDDEVVHIRYGASILNLNSNRFDYDQESIVNGTMPLSALNVIPARIGEFLRPGRVRDFLYRMNTGRYVTVLFSLLLAFYIFKWTKELYGFIPGLFSLLIYTFSPNIIAHSRLIATDLFSACMITISTYYFWQFIKFGGWKRGVLCAFLVGISQLTKYSCVIIYPLFIIILLVRYSGDIMRLVKAGDYKDLAKYLKSFSKYVLIFAIISTVVINIGFLFNRTFTPLGEYRFRSDKFKSFQAKHTILKNFPVPLPYPYIEGIDGHQFDEQKGGKQHGVLYLFGELRRGGGFKGYYFYTYLYKVPIAVQLFVLFALISYILRYKRYRFNFLKDEAFILCPIIFFTIYLNFFYAMHIGIRHFLIALPFLHIFCGSLVKDWERFSPKLKTIVVALVAYLIISVMSYFPHYISYFNELIWDRKQAYKVLSDSNINWGQNRWYLKKYLEKNPDVVVNPEYPTTGRIAVEVNHLTGVFYPEKYRWVRENFEPIDHIAYAYLLFDIPADALEKTPQK